jgi:methylisocitrate lyase
MKKTALLRQYIQEEDILLLPVMHDALCARIAELAGFKAVFTAGYANTAALLGKPDVSLLTLTEMVDCAWRIADATDLPVFADGDTGHGGIPNVIRTVRLMEKAGVAGLFLEDQVFPKRCGHMSGKQVVPPAEMVARLQAALDARVDPDLVIMARTDTLAVHGLDDALERAHLYRETGADMIFVEAPESVEQMRRITREVNAPTLVNLIAGGRTPLLSAAELQGIGYAAAAFATACTATIAKALRETLGKLRATGDLAAIQDHMLPFAEFNELVGMPEIRRVEEKYSR